MNTTDITARLAELAKEISKLEVRKDNATHTVILLEGSDCWVEAGKMKYGRHTIAARTRLIKINRELERARRRHEDLAKLAS